MRVMQIENAEGMVAYWLYYAAKIRVFKRTKEVREGSVSEGSWVCSRAVGVGISGWGSQLPPPDLRREITVVNAAAITTVMTNAGTTNCGPIS